MRKEKSNVKKVVLIIALCLLIAIGAFLAIYFILKKDDIKYYDVKLNSSNRLEFSTNKLSLSPNDNILGRPVRVGLDSQSENAFLRAKIVFESDSNDNRVLSFVSQLNFGIKDLVCYAEDGYNWTFSQQDNAFYLTANSENLKIASKNNSYLFIEKLIVPNSIKQLDTLNSNGDNVQIGEDVTLKIIFEAIQTNLSQKQSDIDSLRGYFNLSANQYENGYYCQNGFITKCTRQDETLILPKYVGNDYVLGICENAFENANLKKIIVPASYIYFNENAFSNLTNLDFIAIKNDLNISLFASTFKQNSSTEIYLSKSMLSFVRQNYSTLPYITNLKQIVEITSSNIENLTLSTSYVYSTLTQINANLSSLENLKVVDFPEIKSINDVMFSGLKSLAFVECPNAKVVGKKAFYECSNLIKVVLDKNAESIGENGFYGCSILLDAEFTKNLAVVENQAFRHCTSLTDVRFEQNDVEIKTSAFFGCTNLRTAYFESLKSCEDNSFVDCPNLRWFVVKSSNDLNVSTKAFSSIEGGKSSNLIAVFLNDNTKTEFITKNPQFANQSVLINITNGELTKFEGNVRNLDLTDFNKIEKITKIGNGVFKDNTFLSSIVMPHSITSLGNNVFDGATSLNKITFNSFVVPLATDKTFENINNMAQIFVPRAVLNVYKQSFEGYKLNILGN